MVFKYFYRRYQGSNTDPNVVLVLDDIFNYRIVIFIVVIELSLNTTVGVQTIFGN